MILIAITIDSTVHRVSNEYCHLTHQWDRKVKTIELPGYKIRSNAGGYVEPLSGTVVFDPSLFVDDWPPPASCAITVYITDTTEEAAAVMFGGYAHREEYSRDGVRYGLYGTSHTSALSSSTYVDDTLVNVFTTYCGASYLNLTLDHTYDRATSPGVYGHFEADTPVVDMLSALAEAANHLFYIKGSTLYLVDMLLDNGATAIEPEGRYYPVTYHDDSPLKRLTSIGVKKYSIAGSYGYGGEDVSDVATGIEHIYGRVGDNSGDDSAWLIHSGAIIPYETNKYYMTKIKVRRPNGTGTSYFGLLGYLSDRTTICDRNGTSDYTLPCWHCLNGAALSTSWQTFTGYSRNWSNPASYVAASSISSPGTLYDNGAGTKAVYFRPILLINHSAQTGKTDLDFIAIYEVDSSGNILEELFYDDFVRYGLVKHYVGSPSTASDILPSTVMNNPVFTSEWVRYGSGAGNRETISSVNESITNVEAALANRKTVLERARATIRMDLTAANLPQPGQSIEWTDEIVSPDGAASVSVAIRARNINFDLDEEKIIVEGEGTITT